MCTRTEAPLRRAARVLTLTSALSSLAACAEAPADEGDLSLFAAQVEAEGSFAGACAQLDRACSRKSRRGCNTFRALCEEMQSICSALTSMCVDDLSSRACALESRFCQDGARPSPDAAPARADASGAEPPAVPDAGLSPPDVGPWDDALRSPDTRTEPDFGTLPDTRPTRDAGLTEDSAGPRNPRTPVPHPIFGVTTDSVGGLDDLKASLASLARKPTLRVVFDYPTRASSYASPVKSLHEAAFIMGELLDSYYMQNKNCRTDLNFAERVDEYLDNATLAQNVDIWEVGNEVNGEWLCKGNTKDVYWTIRTAYDKVKARGKATALTLFFYNDRCANKTNELFNWIDNHIEKDLREGLDYVIISHYETACNYKGPWDEVFKQLGERFPNAWLGFSEVGTESAGAAQNSKLDVLNRYYGLKPMHPRYVGGYFWWYFKQDMVPKSKPLWNALNEHATAWDSLY